MGVQSTFRFPAGSVPGWEAIRASLTDTGDLPVVRMIDGLPAFPGEVPADDWKEIRIGLGGTMVTLRRSAAGIDLVTWGTADPALAAATERVCAALNHLSQRETE
jgi:hypothetical protein